MSTSKVLKLRKKTSLKGHEHHVKMQKWLISDHFLFLLRCKIIQDLLLARRMESSWPGCWANVG